MFKDILRPALSKANRKLTEGVHPFPLENAKPFSGAFLSGFLAERRDSGMRTATGRRSSRNCRDT